MEPKQKLLQDRKKELTPRRTPQGHIQARIHHHSSLKAIIMLQLRTAQQVVIQFVSYRLLNKAVFLI